MPDSFNCRTSLTVGGVPFDIFSLPLAEANGLTGISKLPYSLQILLENLLRHEDGETVTAQDIRSLASWANACTGQSELAFRPARVLTHDFTGIPLAADLAAMRDALVEMGGDPTRINPLIPVDLIIDHSVMINQFGSPQAFNNNVSAEYDRNIERYKFLKWAQSSFERFRVVPPDTGICHQINLEHISRVIWTEQIGSRRLAFPDTVIGTDSHTTMVNAVAVLGWGVGGIEAEAAMLGQPLSMLTPEVVGVRLTGSLREGRTATDLVLLITNLLRKQGVVGKFVEYFGPGVDQITLEDRATISNMAPEYGATCGFFPVDDETIRYLRRTSRSENEIALVEAYCKAQGMFRSQSSEERAYTDVLEIDLATIETSLAGPKRPQDIVPLAEVKTTLPLDSGAYSDRPRMQVPGQDFTLGDGDVVLAAITSCTNTSNPNVMIAAGLVARNAVRLGLKPKPWVKTSVAPGSQVVGEYLRRSGLQKDLDKLGFNLAAYGCTTCIGNSGPLAPGIAEAIIDGNLTTAAVLSGNRNFEARINPDVSANYLASPPLVVAYALAGTIMTDLSSDPLGEAPDGRPVFLRDIWPSSREIADFVRSHVTNDIFEEKYQHLTRGDERWRSIEVDGDVTYRWDLSSTYVQKPPFFENLKCDPKPSTDIESARILALFLDSITTDHISPAGSIGMMTPAARYLEERQVRSADFNQFGTRRGNHEVMIRGAFGNSRIQNQMLPGTKGGVTTHHPSGDVMPIYEASVRYRTEGVSLVVLAGKEYGTGSSRDWAAKGPLLLGVRAVIAQSFERIHRSNLVGMGVLPLVFEQGVSWQELELTGSETVSVSGIAGDGFGVRSRLPVTFRFADGTEKTTTVVCRIDTRKELEYFKSGGILPYMLQQFAA